MNGAEGLDKNLTTLCNAFLPALSVQLVLVSLINTRIAVGKDIQGKLEYEGIEYEGAAGAKCQQ